jgi:hypothetical protein
MHRLISSTQALYYVGTGIWPVADMQSFMAVTGPKTDLWLVETVGLLAAAIGAGTAYAAIIGKFDKPLLLLLLCAAAAFLYTDLYYFFSGVISFMYLPDAVFQLVFIIAHVTRFRRA